MQMPPAYQGTDLAMLSGLADGHLIGTRIVLDGHRPGYLVPYGRADLFAARRRACPGAPRLDRFLGTVRAGAVVPSSTVLGAWQLVLVPRDGTLVQPLRSVRLRDIGYGAVAEHAEASMIPAPRALSGRVEALARGLDTTLNVLAAALRADPPPAQAQPIRPGQIVSLDGGATLRGDGDVAWLRVAGGHARRNGEHEAVFGGTEPALLAGDDWIVVDAPAIAESSRTADLLAAGQLPAALDQHIVLTLRSVDRRFA